MNKTNKSNNNICEEVIIDCLGDMCPVPILRFKKIEENIELDTVIKIITDHSCASENLIEYCKNNNYKVEIIEPISGVWEIFITM